MEEKKSKIVFEERIICPHCNKRIVIKKTKKQISEPVPAEYDEKVIIEKDTQTILKDGGN